MAEDWKPVQNIVTEMLEGVDENATKILGAVQDEILAYAAIPSATLMPQAKKLVVRVLTAINERRSPNEEEISDIVAVVTLRARQNIAVEEVIQAFQFVVRVLWQLFNEQSKAHQLDAAKLVEAAELFWHWIDAVTLPIAQVHRSAEMQMVRHDQAQRQHFLNAILSGTIGGTELVTHAIGYGLHPDHVYVPFRGRLFATDSVEDLQHRVASDKSIVLSGLVERDFAGLAVRRPSWQVSDGAIGIGPATTLRAMSSAFTLASRSLETALRFRFAGVFEIGDLPLQAGILGDNVIGETLWSRFVELPGEKDRQRRTLLSTLASYLDNDRDIERTASVLRVHANTVRNRLNRFEEITGKRLSRTEDLFGAWWALQYDVIRNVQTDGVTLPDHPAGRPEAWEDRGDNKSKPRSGKRLSAQIKETRRRRAGK